MPRTPQDNRAYQAAYRARKRAEKGIDATPGGAAVNALVPAVIRARRVTGMPNPSAARSNYYDRSWPDLIKAMPTDKIDAILDRINVHKVRER